MENRLLNEFGLKWNEQLEENGVTEYLFSFEMEDLSRIEQLSEKEIKNIHRNISQKNGYLQIVEAGKWKAKLGIEEISDLPDELVSDMSIMFSEWAEYFSVVGWYGTLLSAMQEENKGMETYAKKWHTEYLMRKVFHPEEAKTKLVESLRKTELKQQVRLAETELVAELGRAAIEELKKIHFQKKNS